MGSERPTTAADKTVSACYRLAAQHPRKLYSRVLVTAMTSFVGVSCRPSRPPDPEKETPVAAGVSGDTHQDDIDVRVNSTGTDVLVDTAGIPRPIPLPVNVDGIPVSLREIPHWIVWRYELNDERRWTKVPYKAWGSGSRSKASTKNPSHWSTFKEAVASYRTDDLYDSACDGIGFVFSAGCGITGIDLDHAVIDDTPNTYAEGLLNSLPTFAELSPSGTGVHIWLLAAKPEGAGCKWSNIDDKGTNIEIYDDARFFTVTGQPVHGVEQHGDLAPLQQELNNLIASLDIDDDTPIIGTGKPGTTLLADEELLAKARDAKNREKFISLFDQGDTSYHEGDDSAADMALCVMLAFWSNRDTEQMDRLFRQSKLMRPKWDLRRGRSTYGAKTISKAIAGCGDVYTPSSQQQTGSSTEKGRFTPIAPSDFVARPEGPALVKGLLPATGMAMLFGSSGSGKSFLTIDLAMAIARGAQWRGLRTREGRVVYVVAEGAGGFRKRLKAYAKHHDIDLGSVTGTFGVIPHAPNLLAVADVDALVRDLEPFGKVDLVIIDTLAQTAPGGDENSSEDMGLLLRHCRRIQEVTEGLVAIVHHSGKDLTKGARGWSGLKGAMDAMLEVSRIEGSDLRKVRVEKAKDDSDGAEWPFTLDVVHLGVDEDLDPVSSCVIRWQTSSAPALSCTVPKIVVFGIESFFTASCGMRKVRKDAWRRELYGRHTGDSDAKRKAFGRARKELLDAGVLHEDGEHAEIIGDTEVWRGWRELLARCERYELA